MEQTIKIYINDKIYIPCSLIQDTSLLNKYWEFFAFDEPLCKVCDNKKFRVNQQCRLCPGLQKIIRMWDTKTSNNNESFYTLPVGQINEVFKKLHIDIHNKAIQIIDLRCDKQFTYNLQFTAELRVGQEINGLATANQQYLVNKWLEKGYGLIEAPPRTGKTVIGTYLSCFLQRKTLITAHQEELLQNFYKTYETMTNLSELRQTTNKQIVKIITKVEDLEKEDYDVILVNYQKFIREQSAEERINKYLKNKFAFVVVDECHQAAAECFSRFLNKLNPKFALGLSATPKRKDCVSGDTQIQTEEGLLTMSEIVSRVKNKQAIRVYSFNDETKQIELKPVLEAHEKLVNIHKVIELTNNSFIKCTKDHMLY